MKLNNLILIDLYYILISIKVIFARKFIDIKKLSLNDNYFVILDTGLYLYDINTFNCASIYIFNDEYKNSRDVVLIKEFHYKYKAFIICLINEYLFLFNEYTYKVENFKINEIANFKNCYYDLMPYKIEGGNIGFIVAFNNEPKTLLFYFYNFNFIEGLNMQKAIPFMNMNIKNKMIRCQINSYYTFIICFYYSKINEKNYFCSTIFDVDKMNIKIRKTSINDRVVNEIKQIRIAMSFDDNFFTCYANNTAPTCFINDNSYEFKQMTCKHGQGWSLEYKVLYFNETNDFMLVSRSYLTTTILHNSNKSITLCGKNIFPFQVNIYSIIYNNGYQYVNYTNFMNYLECNDISKLEENKENEYKEEAKNSIMNSLNKEDLIENLNEFIKKNININYIDENKELIIPKDNETTITFTSTNIQKINEESNYNYSIIDLGKCEEKLKYVYNISNESDLYILKIDKEQEGKNYPLIDYEVFYPIKDENNTERMEILNLTHCEGIDIEISIPIIINDTIDKHNPKSGYYNDICYKATSENNTDITLKDRRDEFIKNNMSLCEENCELSDYDNIKKRAKCSCKVKTEIFLDSTEFISKNLLKNFIDIKTITNIEIVKCYKIVFNINNLKRNYCSFFVFFIFILYFICLIVFYCKSLKNLIDEIIKIIEIKNKENPINKNIIINNKNERIYSLNNKNIKKRTKKDKIEKNFRKLIPLLKN